MRLRSSTLPTLLLLTICSLCSVAIGAEEVTVSGAGCPTAEEVARVLGELMPRAAIHVTSGGATVRLLDLGARYRVSVRGETREIADQDRHCEERARAAAVLSALMLEPPSLREVTVTDNAPPPPRRLRAEIDAAVLLFAAPRTAPDTSLLTYGGGARATVGVDRVALTLGVAGLSPDTVPLASGGARLTRVPLDLSMRGRVQRGRLEAAADLGISGTVMFVSGQGFSRNLSGTRFEPGVRLAARMAVWASDRIAPFVAVESLWVLRAHDLAIDPSGVLATTPSLWLGISLGVAFRLR